VLFDRVVSMPTEITAPHELWGLGPAPGPMNTAVESQAQLSAPRGSPYIVSLIDFRSPASRKAAFSKSRAHRAPEAAPKVNYLDSIPALI
jgi:hypothetical protein